MAGAGPTGAEQWSFWNSGGGAGCPGWPSGELGLSESTQLDISWSGGGGQASSPFIPIQEGSCLKP